MKIENYKLKIKFSALILVFVLGAENFASAQSVDDLKSKIEDRSREIQKLEEEIKNYQIEINKVGTEAQTLQNTIKTLDINQKKINAEIKKTQTNIDRNSLSLEKLASETKNIENKIEANTAAMANSISTINQNDQITLVETILNSKNLSEIWDEYENITSFQQNIREKSKEFMIYKEELNNKKIETEENKKELIFLKEELSDQNQVLSNTKKEKGTLLTKTKNKETEYKKILAEKKEAKEQFEKELFEFESELKLKVDPNSYPPGKKGILAWPVDNPYITQYFGRTIDAKRLYSSGTHNGIDFRASIGTPIKAVLSGVVQATGNTDTQKGCFSYGKWVLIKHNNGLSTLYAHLNLIRITEGQEVFTGEIIGYSGQTGYATGPHLHFTVFANQGIVIQKYLHSKNCKNVVIPMARPEAYLDPMIYFPSL